MRENVANYVLFRVKKQKPEKPDTHKFSIIRLLYPQQVSGTFEHNDCGSGKQNKEIVSIIANFIEIFNTLEMMGLLCSIARTFSPQVD